MTWSTFIAPFSLHYFIIEKDPNCEAFSIQCVIFLRTTSVFKHPNLIGLVRF